MAFKSDFTLQESQDEVDDEEVVGIGEETCSGKENTSCPRGDEAVVGGGLLLPPGGAEGHRKTYGSCQGRCES